MRPVSKVSIENIANRPSNLQIEILEALSILNATPPETSYIGDLPRTGDILDALGRCRDNVGYASVSRSLNRLWRAGKVNAYSGLFYTRGKGYRWSLAA